MVKKEHLKKQNFTAVKIWIAVGSFLLGLLSMLTAGVLKVSFPLSDVLLVLSPVQVLYRIIPSSILSGIIPSGPIASNLFFFFAYFLNFFIVGMVVSLLLYKKYRKIIYWSIFFALPTSLLFIQFALISDNIPIDSLLPFSLSIIVIAVIVPLGYIVGLYAGSKIIQKYLGSKLIKKQNKQ